MLYETYLAPDISTLVVRENYEISNLLITGQFKNDALVITFRTSESLFLNVIMLMLAA
ncbi:protein of unknown function [Candidatus Nitrosocosmicus franklandus]|uniref:Uncharacterized protein n=1 Tax=Candidatus Nitrosocosmicus franklandianus TaxID=1798806 RepID=A0A484IAK9_9ARCH|nr:protein of unknown function [Candidatus Nitrosocosmicus franklandus]